MEILAQYGAVYSCVKLSESYESWGLCILVSLMSVSILLGSGGGNNGMQFFFRFTGFER